MDVSGAWLRSPPRQPRVGGGPAISIPYCEATSATLSTVARSGGSVGAVSSYPAGVVEASGRPFTDLGLGDSHDVAPVDSPNPVVLIAQTLGFDLTQLAL